jgi:hypothetical protein
MAKGGPADSIDLTASDLGRSVANQTADWPTLIENTINGKGSTAITYLAGENFSAMTGELRERLR